MLEPVLNGKNTAEEIQAIHACVAFNLALERTTSNKQVVAEQVVLPQEPDFLAGPLYRSIPIRSSGTDLVAVYKGLIDAGMVRTYAEDVSKSIDATQYLSPTLLGTLALATYLYREGEACNIPSVEANGVSITRVEASHDLFLASDIVYRALAGNFDEDDQLGGDTPLGLLSGAELDHLDEHDVKTARALIDHAQVHFSALDVDPENDEPDVDWSYLYFLDELLRMAFIYCATLGDEVALLVEDSVYENNYAWFLLPGYEAAQYAQELLALEESSKRGQEALEKSESYWV